MIFDHLLYFTCSKNNRSWKRFWDILPPIQNPSFFLVHVLFVNIDSSLISYSWTEYYKICPSLFDKVNHLNKIPFFLSSAQEEVLSSWVYRHNEMHAEIQLRPLTTGQWPADSKHRFWSQTSDRYLMICDHFSIIGALWPLCNDYFTPSQAKKSYVQL